VRLPNKPRVVVYIYGPSYMGDGGRRTVVWGWWGKSTRPHLKTNERKTSCAWLKWQSICKKKKKKVYISNLLLENLHIKQVKFKPSTTGYWLLLPFFWAIYTFTLAIWLWLRLKPHTMPF
jgi:hypothetical protein